MTPLFPEDHTPIIIEQGNVGDCYLLTSLDCMLNQDDEGRRLIRSLFTEHSDGSISVRIKRTDQSINLNPQLLYGKYHYSYTANEDIFTLGLERLMEIDQHAGGVTTNSLAVKILERISSYYYLNNTADFIDPLASVIAHNRTDKKYHGSSSEFAGKFLGLSVQESNNIYEMINFKRIYSQAAIYLSIYYNGQDSNGMLHPRHALRVDQIILDSSGVYKFILKNPWDNQKSEIYSLEQIQALAARFCIFIKDIRKHQLAHKLKYGSVEEGISVFENLQTLHFLVYLQEICPGLNIHHIQLINKLQQTLPGLFIYISGVLRPDDHIQLLDYMSSSSNFEMFISTLLIKMPRFEFMELILQQKPELQSLGAIVKNVAVIAKSSGYSAINNLAGQCRFFGLVVNAAIAHKALQLAGDSLASKQQIESGLVSYYFSTNLAYLSASMGLREYFNEAIFSFSSIELYFAQSASLFLTYAVAHFFNDPSSASFALKNYLGTANFNLIDYEAFNNLMNLVACDCPDKLDEHLKIMGQINQAFSIKLESLAAQNPVFERQTQNAVFLGHFGVFGNNDISENTQHLGNCWVLSN